MAVPSPSTSAPAAAAQGKRKADTEPDESPSPTTSAPAAAARGKRKADAEPDGYASGHRSKRTEPNRVRVHYMSPECVPPDEQVLRIPYEDDITIKGLISKIENELRDGDKIDTTGMIIKVFSDDGDQLLGI